MEQLRYEEKGSVFLAYLTPLNTPESGDDFLKKLKEETNKYPSWYKDGTLCQALPKQIRCQEDNLQRRSRTCLLEEKASPVKGEKRKEGLRNLHRSLFRWEEARSKPSRFRLLQPWSEILPEELIE